MCECFSSRPKSPNESVLVVTAGHRPLVGGADLWPDWFGPVLGWNRPVPGARRTSVCVGLAGPSPCTQDGAAGCRETKPVCPPPPPPPCWRRFQESSLFVVLNNSEFTCSCLKSRRFWARSDTQERPL